MPYAMHAICRTSGGRPNNLLAVDSREGLYESGIWSLDGAEAETLRGGWLYLHETSAGSSYFSGRIEGVDGPDHEGKYRVVVRKVPGSESPRRGRKAGQNVRHNFRIVEATHPHETA